jgi:cytochrome c-type biogenesis protein CcmE
MSKKAARIGVTSLVLVMAFAGLLYSTMGESLEYYKKVDEVMVNPQEWHGKALQLHGYAKGVGRKADSLDWRFDIHNNGKVVRAYYTGVTPDTFKEDSEVVVKGRLADDNTFHATEIIAKCPSKYDPAAAPAGTSGTE